MRQRTWLLGAALLAALLPALPARADGAQLTVVSAPAEVHRGLPSSVTAVLHDATGAPLAGAEVVLERTPGTGRPAWQQAGLATSAADGSVSVAFTPVGSALYRLRSGDAVSATFVVRTTAAPSTLTVRAARSVRYDATWSVRVSWDTSDGLPVTGPVLLQRKEGSRWVTVSRGTTSAAGTALLRTPAVEAGAFRVAAAAVPSATGTVSGTLALAVPPAYALVPDPAGAPRPTRVLVQPRATTPGLDARVEPIPDDVWRQMVGRTWHSGCPVGRAQLALVTMNYYGFDGYRHRGELVVAARVAPAVVRAFTRIYAAAYPIRLMVREDVFGWSAKLHGANDYASMAADNTSGFNCRGVVGQPHVRSPHAYGIAIDVNTLENPDVARDGTWPSAHYADRSLAHPALIRPGDAVVRAFASVGWRWGASFRDYQHFDTARGHD
ncbi:D-alanyl-D-alanine carboxypeptidase-like protein [Motilibacter rhizosphaerae]|uniref:D-alanyl-D-alanine carboxypeptidase-like protein n=1 Tax=Motilibacter rhizosphaerae TaxID=598652 RepID=A0A4Q7NUT4_9ACTN|nr:M15 family metallopeptidase [Motilibacter rhizosphaerae]RZS90973.1 D-alanyl-D-alanine carboxypeptidase-like protein [Motilibacter rhizosphaerae]